MIKRLLLRITTGLTAFALIIAGLSHPVAAASLTARSVTIGSSVALASTTYTFTFTAPSATTIKSISFQACTTASGTCTTPSGFVNGGIGSAPTGLGSGGTWTGNTSTAGSLRVLNNSNTGSPSAGAQVFFTGVTNPSATNSTFFFRITTYSDSTWTTPIDTGTVATSTAGQITVTASVDEALTFTLGSSTVALGTLTTSSTGSGTSSMTVSTNGASGYAVTVNGTTLTSGSNTITALTSPTASSQNNKQFGLNLVANTTPSVGSAVSGTGTGTAASGYNTSNSYKFVTGETVASATGPTNSNTFTVSYIANVDGSTAAGSYSTLLTYIATANF